MIECLSLHNWDNVRSFSNQYDNARCQALNDVFDLKAVDDANYFLRHYAAQELDERLNKTKYNQYCSSIKNNYEQINYYYCVVVCFFLLPFVGKYSKHEIVGHYYKLESC